MGDCPVTVQETNGGVGVCLDIRDANMAIIRDVLTINERVQDMWGMG